MKALLTIILYVLLDSCAGGPPVPQDTSDCPAACATLQRLHCPEGGDVTGPRGEKVSCVDFCTLEQRQNRVELNPSCVKNITACDQLETTCSVGHAR